MAPLREAGDDTDFARRAWSIALKVMIPITLSYIGWSLNNIITNQREIAVIKANRFTQKDGQELERRMDTRYGLIQEQLSTMRTDVAVIRQILEQNKKEH